MQQTARHLHIERLESAAKFQSFIEQLGGMAYIANPDANAGFLYVCQELENLIGFTSEEWRKDPELRIKQLHPDDRDIVLKAIGDTISTKNAMCADYRVVTRDGEIRWLHDEARIIANPQGIPLFLQGVVIDVTQRKLAQVELERSHRDLQRMIAASDSMREEQQRRLAQEMHDDFGQLLAAMKMDLSALGQRLPQGDAKLLQQLTNINDLVDAMITSVRRIIADLPPKVLEERGLFEAIELLVSDFRKRHTLYITLELPNPLPFIEDEIAAPVYRMMQESLNNVAKHAQATRVDILIAREKNYLVLRIVDNGIGMPIGPLRKIGSLGLIGMRERATALGGEIKIDSPEGSGTRIQIAIPLDVADISPARKY